MKYAFPISSREYNDSRRDNNGYNISAIFSRVNKFNINKKGKELK